MENRFRLFARAARLVGLACVAVLFGAWAVPAAGPPALGAKEKKAEAPAKYMVKALKDIAYYEGPGHDPIKHKLDLFLPIGLKDFPVLLFVHGGAWVHGDKDFLGVYSALARALASQGVGVVVTNYRLSPGVRHPEHVKDVARAFAWTHKNIAKHGGSPEHLFVSGHSAGGHLVSLLGTDETYLRAEGLTGKAVRGVVTISGVYDIPAGFLPKVFGAGPKDGPGASPIRHVRAGLSPFLVLWADKDFETCGKAPSQRFAKALQDKGNRVETLEIAESNHYVIIAGVGKRDSAANRALLAFLRANTRR